MIHTDLHAWQKHVPYFLGEQFLFDHSSYNVTPPSQHATRWFCFVPLHKISLWTNFVYCFGLKRSYTSRRTYSYPNPPINTEKSPTCLPASCCHGNGPTGWHCELTGAPSSRHPIVNTGDSRVNDIIISVKKWVNPIINVSTSIQAHNTPLQESPSLEWMNIEINSQLCLDRHSWLHIHTQFGSFLTMY